MNHTTIDPLQYLDYGAMGLHALVLVVLLFPLIWWLARSFKSSQDRTIEDLRHDLKETRADLNDTRDRREAAHTLYAQVAESVAELTRVMVENTEEVKELRSIFTQRIKPHERR